MKNKPNVTFLNAEFSVFLNSEGHIDPADMYDYLHFTNEGYRKFCEPLVEEVQNLLQTFIKVENTSMESSTTALDEESWSVPLGQGQSNKSYLRVWIVFKIHFHCILMVKHRMFKYKIVYWN